MDKRTKTAVIIVAAGRGERAGTDHGPKQYRSLGGRSVIDRAIAAFSAHDGIDLVQPVIHADDHELFAVAAKGGPKLLPPVNGGATRQASVLAGLDALTHYNCERVLVHDAARPFVTAGIIDRVLNGLDNSVGALPTLAVADSLQKVDNNVVGDTVSREGLHIAQTPQGFAFEPFHAAHKAAANKGVNTFTDDSSLMRDAGHEVTSVEGDAVNTKLTTADDIARAQAAFSVPDIRVGHGYDTHQLVDGDSIWLCGVELPHSRKLSGHSDADVGLHALTDALLATIADGDIGSHFPPSDEKWKGAKSDQFLAHAIGLVRKAGGTVTHMDVTLLCESPKIGPHRDVMRGAMASITGVDRARISVKATTNERIGFIGREEGIVALATATAVFGVVT
ncbi:bifunctional 2-C-methyl-D-erythritol 4-phosphate cytidylyltransferase/2-C-methyl-D-erythritol 2,4-cyclodiphosphate synthase [Ahrensia sp. R2A130]|uniref:bifunctional 2-C-methyl-D-erythritol 4-phosphate cytidylyltransferase/2-C-methyl-D-erythritol 2,4-cyclodiphosphate synthase n=1 Tax=Ahrensia sp. R2A130 TaxID=744979 RepID=UPI0001E0B459|nr:bifunctional 2-C-methyl-D-erythritol 4-phosphate cytidylyltransferase/2-C-methyl-D-erythritol 2,4-cyclodiphosphate synthase [Ahrensia sp. R2A130]EFL90134.1 bifunctional enzyme IspD/ispF [Ahrensia sp. R2A130]